MDWNDEEKALFDSLNSPTKIQEFLDTLAYNTDGNCRSPREVIKTRKAHCMDGAIFAATALEYQGFPALILDLVAENDDDHVIAIYQENGLWGAIAKSNTTLLRYRNPVYLSIRELAMSYFFSYFNSKGEMSLRTYSEPFELATFDYKYSSEDIYFLSDELDKIEHFELVPKNIVINLPYAPKYLVDACFSGSDEKGLYKPN